MRGCDERDVVVVLQGPRAVQASGLCTAVRRRMCVCGARRTLQRLLSAVGCLLHVVRMPCAELSKRQCCKLQSLVIGRNGPFLLELGPARVPRVVRLCCTML